jgi:hypothetical protein
MPLKIYSPARTVVDCFKFRNTLGLDVALEALRLVRQRTRVQNRELLRYARLLRVENPIGQRQLELPGNCPRKPLRSDFDRRKSDDN